MTTAPPAVSTLDGRAADREALTSAVVLFWRADCGPCLSELADLRALKKAAAPLKVQPVVLEQTPGGVGPAEAALARAGLRPSDTLRAPGAPERILTTWGGAPPRLPLAVVFDGAGRVCGRHTGLLGYDRLHAWAAACGGRRAPRR